MLLGILKKKQKKRVNPLILFYFARTEKKYWNNERYKNCNLLFDR
jgi:hypothetical protein